MISSKISSGLNGEVKIPGDKSISHRSIIISSISKGYSEIDNILKSEDVINTLNAFRSMGVDINEDKEKIYIHGNGLNSLIKPKGEIYLGNSGTSARLLTGLLSSQNFNVSLTGDKSLSKRPMRRITEPLIKMNANIKTTNGSMPIFIKGQKLKNNTIDIRIPSAQIKSGVILAALNTKGITEIIEHNITRDHTEIMLKAFGADINITNLDERKLIKIRGQQELNSKDINIPSDLSSSAFFIVAGLINNNSKILLRNININPTRNGILIALKKMGANISYFNNKTSSDEEVCDIEVSTTELQGCELGPEIAKLMIDEYPILSIAASFAKTPSIFRGLGELKVKESDRLKLIVTNLERCGVQCNVVDDDLFIYPSKNFEIRNNNIKTDYDHRIAMAFAVMGSKIGSLKIKDSESINTSFPSFIEEFNKIGGIITWKK